MGFEPDRRPSGAEQFLQRVNPEWESWRGQHNEAFKKDESALSASLQNARDVSRGEQHLRDNPNGDHHSYRLMENNITTDLAKNWPAGALPFDSRIQDGRIRDVNTVTVDGQPYAYAYRTTDGKVYLQRDSASTDTISDTGTTTNTLTGTLTGGGKVGASGGEGVTVNGEVNGSGSVSDSLANAKARTSAHPNLNPLIEVHDLGSADLPPGSNVTPLMRKGTDVQVAGSQQILPPNPHHFESKFDTAHARPEPITGGFDVPLGSYTIRADHQGQVSVEPPQQSQTLSRTH